jgi:hypothetical protein
VIPPLKDATEALIQPSTSSVSSALKINKRTGEHKRAPKPAKPAIEKGPCDKVSKVRCKEQKDCTWNTGIGCGKKTTAALKIVAKDEGEPEITTVAAPAHAVADADAGGC